MYGLVGSYGRMSSVRESYYHGRNRFLISPGYFMLVIPYWTNSPIYYLPIMTVVMIVVNCVVSIVAFENPELLEAMVLRVDGTLNPLTWLSSSFIHADYSHLLGNMIFLWCFGVIVEGRIGPIWMTICFLLIGVTQAAGLQLTMWGISWLEPLRIRGALGASAAIYGLMVMSFLWSFDDDLISFVLLYPFYINYGLPVSVSIYCVIYLSFDLLEALLEGWSSGLLHIAGATAGLAVGLLVTPTGLVKGEKPNFFHWLRDLPGRSRAMADGTARSQEEQERERARHDREQQRFEEDAHDRLQKIQILVGTKQFLLATEQMRHLVASNPLVTWKPDMMGTLISGLLEQKEWLEADALLTQYTQLFPNQNYVSTRIRWAQTKLQQEMPRKALGILSQMQGQPVTAGQKQAIRDLAAHAKRMIAEGIVELE